MAHPKSAQTLRVAVIGAGMAGILTAIRLKEAGYDFAVYEKGDRLGGTWRENTYPGLACDVPAHLYTYSFEPNPDWSHVFAPGPEIQAYFESVAQKYGVEPFFHFGKEVTTCEFREGRWHLEMQDGSRDTVDVVIAATGVLHHPNIPEFPGIETFEGASFHSARWDHDVALDGRRVGVIGTGSTAVQITSALVPRVAQYALFQRSAQWIMPGANPAYTEEEKAGFASDPEALKAMREEMNSAFLERLANAVIDAESPGMKAIEDACHNNLEKNVRDPELRERLRPTYRAACKRLIFSPDFYDVIQQPNATLVTSGIKRIEPRGVRTEDGALHELDVLVLATGFLPDRFIRPTVVKGRGGRDLDEVWEHRPIAYLSLSVPDFPNFFMLNGPNGPVGNFSLIQIAEFQLGYVLQLMDEIRNGRCREISASSEATTSFDTARIAASKSSIWATGCTSWYLDKDGVPASWPWSYTRFEDEMREPKLEAYDRL